MSKDILERNHLWRDVGGVECVALSVSEAAVSASQDSVVLIPSS